MGDRDTKLICLQLTGPGGHQDVTGADVVGSQGALLFHVSTGPGGNVTKAPGAGLYVWIASPKSVTRDLVAYRDGAWRVVASTTAPLTELPRSVGEGLIPARRYN